MNDLWIVKFVRKDGSQMKNTTIIPLPKQSITEICF